MTGTTTTNLIEPEKRGPGRPPKVHEPIKILDERDLKNVVRNRTAPPGMVYFVEVPPNSHRIRTHDGSEFLINLPWTYYTITFNDAVKNKWYAETPTVRICSIYGRPTQTKGSPQERFYYLPIPNQYPRSKTFCMGTALRVKDKNKDILQTMNQAIAFLWGSTFTYVNLRTETEIWNNIAKLTGRNDKLLNPKNPVSINAYFNHDLNWIYEWWEQLTPKEVLKFPWGKKMWGTFHSIINSAYYGYEAYA